MSRFVFLCGLFCLVGCAHFRCDPNYTGPQQRDHSLIQYYSYQHTDIDEKIEKIEDKNKYLVYKVEFPHRGEIIRIDYYELKSEGKFPTLLVSPILEGNYTLAKNFSKYFASNGFNCALVYRSKGLTTVYPDADSIECLLRQTVIKNRRVIDWLTEQKKVDSEKLGSFGLSLGGILNSITAAIEPRLKCNVIMLAGGGIADVICGSKTPEVRNIKKAIMKNKGISSKELHKDLLKKINSDPVKLAKFIDARGVLMYIALFDWVIPTNCGKRLWRAVGKPEVIYLPCGHYTSVLTVPYARYQSLKFLKRVLK